MAFHVECACGQRIEVSAGMAGSEVRCGCGELNRVPGLSELRRCVGQEAYVTNTVEQVNKMLARGELPPGSNCMICHSPTRAALTCELVCAKSWTRKMEVDQESRDPLYEALGFFLLGLLWKLVTARRRFEKKTMGHDVSVRVPLRLCDACRRSLGGLRRSRAIKRLLRQVPVYARLLEEYPRAKVRIIDRNERRTVAGRANMLESRL
jgi:hypothetical protein